MTQATTSAGVVHGESVDGVRIFRGIPYAAPPVGERRWRAPAPVEPWTGVLDATRFGNDCPQRSALPLGSRAAGQSEDCLTLNVWAPEQAVGLPVMVWIFGGSFVYGSGAEDRADGMPFARDGIVYVSINYRVGMFGFLAHPELTAEAGASGNYGLLDQIAALHWVQGNIAAFGGDPTRVTLFGVSAGAASISLLATSPLATGLFAQMILQSPGAFRPLATLADAEAAGAALAPSIQALRALSADELLDRQKQLESAVRSLTKPRILRPIRDGQVVVEDDRDAYLGGRFAKVPAIIGSVADEGSAAVASWPVKTPKEFQALLATTFGDQAKDAAPLYPAPVAVGLGELFGDTQFTYGVAALSQVFADFGLPIYRYVFTRIQPGKATPMRHSEDVSYVFRRPELPPRGETDHRFDTDDLQLADRVHADWVAFAKTGDPGPAWPRYRPGTATLMDYGVRPTLRAGWRDAQMAFLDRFFDPED